MLSRLACSGTSSVSWFPRRSGDSLASVWWLGSSAWTLSICGLADLLGGRCRCLIKSKAFYNFYSVCVKKAPGCIDLECRERSRWKAYIWKTINTWVEVSGVNRIGLDHSQGRRLRLLFNSLLFGWQSHSSRGNPFPPSNLITSSRLQVPVPPQWQSVLFLFYLIETGSQFSGLTSTFKKNDRRWPWTWPPRPVLPCPVLGSAEVGAQWVFETWPDQTSTTSAPSSVQQSHFNGCFLLCLSCKKQRNKSLTFSGPLSSHSVKRPTCHGCISEMCSEMIILLCSFVYGRGCPVCIFVCNGCFYVHMGVETTSGVPPPQTSSFFFIFRQFFSPAWG